jgi:Mn-dependent DtxR family transcriptional regulator
MKAPDPLDTPAVGGLAEMLQAERDGKPPLNMRRFHLACRCSPERSRQTLKALEAAGLVAVDRNKQGRTEILTLRLTPAGREVAIHLAAAHETLKRLQAPRAPHAPS